MKYYLAHVLSLKSDIGVRIKNCYDKADNEGLRKIAQEELPELSTRMSELRLAHRRQWFKLYKPFGWEVLDTRYGGLLARIDSSKARLDEYLDKSIERIEELEEERLYFDCKSDPREIKFFMFKTYSKIISAGVV